MKYAMKKILSIALAVSVVLVCFTTAAFADTTSAGVSYSAHVQDIGWQAAVSDGATAGTSGLSKRVEALKATLTNAPLGAHINYQVHVQDRGWMTAVSDGASAGTTGENKRIEAIKMTISGVTGYSIEYRVHVQDIGWMNWVKNGAVAGTVGQSKRIEAIQIRLAADSNDSLSITPSMTLTVGGATGTIAVTVAPVNEANNISWSSDNPAAATVSNGVVTPVAAGAATITASVGGKTATCLVTVITNAVSGIGYIEPVAFESVAVRGLAVVGQKLTAVLNSSNVTVSYQWMIFDPSTELFTNISGATSKTYVLTENELDKYICVAATGVGYYTGSHTSSAVGAVLPASEAFGAMINMIGYLDNDTLTYADDIAAARESYNSLTIVQQAQVTNYAVLLTAEATLKGDRYEYDDIYQRATNIIADGTHQTHTIYPATDVDWIKFDATEGHTYTIETSNLFLSTDTYIYLYGTDRDNALLYNDDGGLGVASKIEFTAPATGTYYIQVIEFQFYDSHDSATRVGQYDISITEMPI